MKKQKPPAVPGQGDVKILLDGVEVTLQPTLAACIGISRLHNAPMITVRKILDMDFDTIVAVTAFGLGVTPNEKFQEKVYRTGILEMRDALIRFVHIVNNGGREIPDDEEVEEEEENPQLPSQ